MFFYKRKRYGVNRLRMSWESNKALLMIVPVVIIIVLIMSSIVDRQYELRSPDGFTWANMGNTQDGLAAIQSCTNSSNACNTLLVEPENMNFDQILCWHEEGIIVKAMVEGQTDEYILVIKGGLPENLKPTDLECP